MQLIGSLFYTCPDIAFAVNYCSLHMKSPTEFHLQLAYKILAHIISTKHQGLNFKFNVPISLNASVDASYASHSDRKSHLGITLHIGDNNAAFTVLQRSLP